MTAVLGALAHNLLAGLRVALFRRVSLSAFRVDVAAWLAIVVLSALLDIALDGLRAAPDAAFSWAGLDGELYATGLLMVTAALIAAATRDARAFIAVPIVILASFPLLQVIHALPAIAGVDLPEGTALAVDTVLFAWMLAVCVRTVHVACEAPEHGRILRAVAGGVLLSAPLWFSPLAGPGNAWWDDGDDDESGLQSVRAYQVLHVVPAASVTAAARHLRE